LVKGNPTALQSPDNGGALPLHIACEHHDSISVVEYLVGVGLDTSALVAVDNEGNTALHYACRSTRHEIITLLLGKYDAVSVSMRNGHKKLPIDLLLESNEVEDRDNESIEYTESVFRLLKAYPETVMNILTGQVKNLTLV
jgi:ankyrin repeat protein